MTLTALTTLAAHVFVPHYVEVDLGDFGALARAALGRKPKNNDEIRGALAPLVEAGLLTTRIAMVAPKGCPGGRARPALIARPKVALTEKGLKIMTGLAATVYTERARRLNPRDRNLALCGLAETVIGGDAVRDLIVELFSANRLYAQPWSISEAKIARLVEELAARVPAVAAVVAELAVAR